MTEIPEHLRKRAEEAREKAAAAAGGAAPATPPPRPAASRRPPQRGREQDPRPPARAGQGGQGARPAATAAPRPAAAVAAAAAGAVATAAATAAPPRRRGPGRSHPAPAHGRQVRLDPGRQGHAAGQGPRVAAPARRRVRRRAGLHGVPADLLDLRQRPAARSWPTPTRRRTPRRRRGTSSACRSCSRCSTRWSPA